MRLALPLLLICLLLCGLSLWLGASGFGFEGRSRAEAWVVIRDSRLPRTLAALLTGAGLAIAGQIMQLIARNRFVEPMTAGTGQGAVLGILLASVFLPGASIAVKMLLASATALMGSLGFFAITRRLPPSQPLLVPLAGLVYGGVIGGGVTFAAFQTDMLQYLEIWISGEFSGTMRGRYELLWLAGLAALFSYLVADQFSILGLGAEVSLNLGLNYQQVVMSGLAVIAVVSGVTVVTVGLIPFVGLVVPNLVSRFCGDNMRRNLPLTALAGAMLVLASDLAGRLLIHPFEVPAATVIGILGAAAFLWLLYGRGRHAW